jgi:hypothetical protein
MNLNTIWNMLRLCIAQQFVFNCNKSDGHVLANIPSKKAQLVVCVWLVPSWNKDSSLPPLAICALTLIGGSGRSSGVSNSSAEMPRS